MPTILRSLVMLYADGDFAADIDGAGGTGTAVLASQAIAVYCDGVVA